MSDNTQAPVIVRNDVSKTLVKQTFGKKSNNAGKEFYAPEFSQASWDEDVKWTGLDWFVSLGNKVARKVFGDLHVDNIDDKTGEFNFDQWKLDAEDFTAGVAKLSDLQDDLDELVGLQQTYALDPEFGEDNEHGHQLQELITGIAHKIKPIRAQIASIKVKYAERAEKRKAKEEASATKGTTESVTA